MGIFANGDWPRRLSLGLCGAMCVFGLTPACSSVDEDLLKPPPSGRGGASGTGGAGDNATGGMNGAGTMGGGAGGASGAVPMDAGGSGGAGDTSSGGAGGMSGRGGAGGASGSDGDDAGMADAGGCIPNPDTGNEVCPEICPESCNGEDDDCDRRVDEDADLDCTLDNATATCNRGTCEISTCDTGFLSCDDDHATGCEADPMSDPVHCGDCDTDCTALANASETTCSSGACQIGACNTDWDDCDGYVENGCEAEVGAGDCSCTESGPDGDTDGAPDCIDGCDADPLKTDPGQCGCGTDDEDADTDGTADCNDMCPDDPNKTAPGQCDCGIADDDADTDGTADCNDMCPNDPGKTAPGQCDCGIADTDSDSDGTADCNEVPDAWHKPLTMDSAQIPGALTDFPVLVRLTDPSDLGTRARADGLDIFFEDAGGAPLDFEIERWDGATGSLVAWVRIPSLDDASDTVIYVVYGDGMATDRSNASGVWNSDFNAVWHLDDLGDVSDSAGGHTGVSTGATSVGGVAGDAANFDGAAYIDLPTASLSGISSEITVSVWLYGDPADQPQNQRTFHAEAPSERVINAQVPYGDGQVYWDAGNGTGMCCRTDVNRLVQNASTSEYAGQWNYYVFTKNTASDSMRIYLNGAPWASSGGSQSIGGDAVAVFTLGGKVDHDPDFSYDGYVDEFRISKTERSEAWIATSYNNQVPGSDFITVGLEQAR